MATTKQATPVWPAQQHPSSLQSKPQVSTWDVTCLARRSRAQTLEQLLICWKGRSLPRAWPSMGKKISSWQLHALPQCLLEDFLWDE